MRKHPGGDRTGSHMSQAKITSELAKVINDGLYYYEQDLWMEDESAHTAIKKYLQQQWPIHYQQQFQNLPECILQGHPKHLGHPGYKIQTKHQDFILLLKNPEPLM